MITDVYFKRSLLALAKAGLNPVVTYNVFIRAKKHFIVCGIKKAEDIIRSKTRGYGVANKQYSDGDLVPAGATTLFTYTGHLAEIITIETEVCAALSAQSTAATAMCEIVDAANGKPVFYFGARHRSIGADEDWCAGAMAGGAAAVATTPTAESMCLDPVGTMPHAFILACGSTLEASRIYRNAFPNTPLVVLIDTFGRELTDSVELVKYWGKELHAVRIDTHGGRYCEGVKPPAAPDTWIHGPGVCLEAVRALRHALDDAGGQRVQIVASSGFTVGKTALFEALGAPVDSYGVGLGHVDTMLMATADIVAVNGKRCHKTGRYENRFDGDNFIPGEADQ